MSNKAVHMLMLGLMLASMLAMVIAPARAVTVTNGIPSQTPPLSVIDGTATFDLINFNTNHQIISNWTEGGMRFTCPPGIYAHGGSFIPPGFTDQNFYYDTGVFGLYGIQRANGEAFSALQFDTAHTGGGVWDYIWMVVRLHGQSVSSYDLNIQMQLGRLPPTASRSRACSMKFGCSARQTLGSAMRIRPAGC